MGPVRFHTTGPTGDAEKTPPSSSSHVRKGRRSGIIGEAVHKTPPHSGTTGRASEVSKVVKSVAPSHSTHRKISAPVTPRKLPPPPPMPEEEDNPFVAIERRQAAEAQEESVFGFGDIEGWESLSSAPSKEPTAEELLDDAMKAIEESPDQGGEPVTRPRQKSVEQPKDQEQQYQDFRAKFQKAARPRAEEQLPEWTAQESEKREREIASQIKKQPQQPSQELTGWRLEHQKRLAGLKAELAGLKAEQDKLLQKGKSVRQPEATAASQAKHAQETSALSLQLDQIAKREVKAGFFSSRLDKLAKALAGGRVFKKFPRYSVGSIFKESKVLAPMLNGKKVNFEDKKQLEAWTKFYAKLCALDADPKAEKLKKLSKNSEFTGVLGRGIAHFSHIIAQGGGGEEAQKASQILKTLNSISAKVLA